MYIDRIMRTDLLTVSPDTSLEEAKEIFEKKKIDIQNLFCWAEKDYPGITQLILRVGSEDGQAAITALEIEGFKVSTKYKKDITGFLPDQHPGDLRTLPFYNCLVGKKHSKRQ